MLSIDLMYRGQLTFFFLYKRHSTQQQKIPTRKIFQKNIMQTEHVCVSVTMEWAAIIDATEKKNSEWKEKLNEICNYGLEL